MNRPNTDVMSRLISLRLLPWFNVAFFESRECPIFWSGYTGVSDLGNFLLNLCNEVEHRRAFYDADWRARDLRCFRILYYLLWEIHLQIALRRFLREFLYDISCRARVLSATSSVFYATITSNSRHGIDKHDFRLMLIIDTNGNSLEECRHENC